jgi:hypothetical protein
MVRQRSLRNLYMSNIVLLIFLITLLSGPASTNRQCIIGIEREFATFQRGDTPIVSTIIFFLHAI